MARSHARIIFVDQVPVRFYFVELNGYFCASESNFSAIECHSAVKW
nr:MAG TPA_asm: hypothetical protein [Caudoviricetes sp.]